MENARWKKGTWKIQKRYEARIKTYGQSDRFSINTKYSVHYTIQTNELKDIAPTQSFLNSNFGKPLIPEAS